MLFCGKLLNLAGGATSVPMPELPAFLTRDGARPDHGTKDLRSGFSIDVWLRLTSLREGQVILDNRTPSGQGLCLRTGAGGRLEIVMNDGRTESRWDSDPGLLRAGEWHHAAVIVDGGPKIILFLIDGKLCDGGDYRQFGWGRYNPNLPGVAGEKMLRIGVSLEGELKRLRIYNRALRTSEAIGNYRAGPS